MIAFVSGVVADLEEDAAIIETGGVGYRIFVPSSVASRLVIGEQAKLHTYYSVREDAANLFGFLTKDDLFVYKLLISVSGIGPKAGLAILSTMTANDIRYAVTAGDEKAITKAPGIGLKTAKKVILELKDKLSIEDMFEHSDSIGTESLTGDQDTVSEAVLALTALGYSQSEAVKAVRKVDVTDQMTVEELLKLALKKVSL